MKILLTGLPHSGTSLFAHLLHRLGFSSRPPHYAKANYQYRTYESMLGRSINRALLGGWYWRPDRWAHTAKAINPPLDSELPALADWWWREGEGDWFFKQPECLLTWDAIWSRYEWDHVVGVYRRPEDVVHSWHYTDGHGLASWNRWNRKLLRIATTVVRFPDDVEPLCSALGRDVPEGRLFALGHPKQRTEGPVARPCRDVWERLEARR